MMDTYTNQQARILALLCVALALAPAACGKRGPGQPAPDDAGDTVAAPAPPAAPAPAPPPSPWQPPERAQLEAHPDWFRCTADADCAIVDLGCCDFCNGGAAISVRGDARAEAEALWRERDCLEQTPEGSRSRDCTELECAALEPRCHEGTCASDPGDGSALPNPVVR